MRNNETTICGNASTKATKNASTKNDPKFTATSVTFIIRTMYKKLKDLLTSKAFLLWFVRLYVRYI